MLLDPVEHIISLQNLSIGYEKDRVLLSDINLSVRPGEMVALIGRNGTGKSTLLKSMIGLIPVLNGACYLDGVPFHTFDLGQRARKVSYVSSQLAQLPSINVRELVSMGRMPFTGWMGKLAPGDMQMVERALKEVQMETFVDRKLDQLSDGERQRAMIARALCQDTPLMVLDEPTAFLDIPNKYELIRLLSGFKDGGKSIVYSTHDLETAMHCADKIWVIHEGNILEGAPEDMGISGLYNTLFKAAGINYDEKARRFKYTSAQKGSIQLEGEPGKELLWTRSTLERLGFRVHKSGPLHLLVTVEGADCRWRLTGNGVVNSFENLYSLARFLIQEE